MKHIENNTTISSAKYDEYIEEYQREIKETQSEVDPKWIPIVKILREVGGSVCESNEISSQTLVQIIKRRNPQCETNVIEKVVDDLYFWLEDI